MILADRENLTDHPLMDKNTSLDDFRGSIAIFGSTGSIGQSTLDVIRHAGENYSVFCLSANKNAELLLDQIKEFRPKYAVIVNEEKYRWLKSECLSARLGCEIVHGAKALDEIAADANVDIVMAAIVGSAGLSSTFAAVSSGKKVLLANKEALVMAGKLMVDEFTQSGGQLLPVDSEHNAIFQCLQNTAINIDAIDAETMSSAQQLTLKQRGVSRLLLTGSGGPFRQLPIAEFTSVSPEQACAHPNWSMGRKISVDSATMMNKGLELIEACWLFNCSADNVDIVIHPESVIHSMVEFIDGSVIAQLGQPDMRTPIAHALAWPRRISTAVQRIDWRRQQQLTFHEPDHERFPALSLCREVAAIRGNASVVLNAANEIAVDAFLTGKIKYLNIVKLVEKALEKDYGNCCTNIDELIALDQRIRHDALDQCHRFSY